MQCSCRVFVVYSLGDVLVYSEWVIFWGVEGRQDAGVGYRDP